MIPGDLGLSDPQFEPLNLQIFGMHVTLLVARAYYFLEIFKGIYDTSKYPPYNFVLMMVLL